MHHLACASAFFLPTAWANQARDRIHRRYGRDQSTEALWESPTFENSAFEQHVGFRML
jgi:hypothetical protein